MGVPAKWIDNILSHHELPGIERTRQGVERRISDDGLLAIEIIRILSREAGLTIPSAALIVTRAIGRRQGSLVRVELAPGIELRIDASHIEQRLRERLADAIDAAPRVARGRPPKHAKKTTPDV